MFGLSETVTMQLIAILVMAGGFFGQWLRERAARRRVLDDRQHTKEEDERKLAEIVERAKAEAEAARIKAEAAADVIRIELQQIAERQVLETRKAASLVREDQRKTADAMAAHIEEVRTAAVAAIHEANGVNAKLEQTNQRLLEVAAVAAEGKAQKLEEIHEDVRTNTAKVEEVKTTVDKIDKRSENLF